MAQARRRIVDLNFAATTDRRAARPGPSNPRLLDPTIAAELLNLQAAEKSPRVRRGVARGRAWERARNARGVEAAFHSASAVRMYRLAYSLVQ